MFFKTALKVTATLGWGKKGNFERLDIKAVNADNRNILIKRARIWIKFEDMYYGTSIHESDTMLPPSSEFDLCLNIDELEMLLTDDGWGVGFIDNIEFIDSLGKKHKPKRSVLKLVREETKQRFFQTKSEYITSKKRSNLNGL